MAILEVHGLHGRGLDVMLEPEQRYSIGRRDSCDLVIADDDAVSRDHLLVEPVGQRWRVQELGTRNGTLVNGEPLAFTHTLRHNDEVVIGRHTKLVFRDAKSARGGTTSVVDEPPDITPGEHKVLIELLRPMYEGGGGAFTMPSNVAAMAKALFVGEGAVKAHLGSLYDKYGIPPSGKGEEARFVRLARVAYLRGPVSAKDYAKGAK